VNITNTSAKLSFPTPRPLTNVQLAGYQDQENLGSYKITCAGQMYVAANNQLYPVDLSVAKDYPGKSTVLSDPTCALFTFTDQAFGHYVGTKTVDAKTKVTKYQAYKILKGKKLPFKNLGAYKKDNLSDPPIVWVDDAFLSNLGSGNQIDTGGSTKPTPTPKPTPNPDQYTIKSGDSLSSIATKFNTTVAKLMALNGIVDANRIKIGQVIKLH
jgi:LysM repeat protein